MSFWGYRDYVSVADRRAKATREIARLKKQGRAVAPVVIEGRKIAKLFWGKAWCDNLERYSDFANRLPRGRSYLCNGFVIDLVISRGLVEALVSGSDTYKVKVEIAVAAPARWKAICSDCSGSVGSIVELLQGKLSGRVMERVCRAGDGLFPAPKEIKMSCSCPDWAGMCKHVAAALYGVGARLDVDPNVLFTLRGVDRAELVSTGADVSITQSAAGSARVLVDDDLSALFGVEIEAPAGARAKPKPAAKASRPNSAAAVPVTTKAIAKKPSGKTARKDEGRPVERPSQSKSKRRTAPGKGADRVSVDPPKLRADSAAASLAKTSAPAKGSGSSRSPARSGEPTSARSEPKAAASAKNKPTPTRKPMLGTVVDIENWWKARQSPTKPAIPR
jgi:uncharacterized Zn finger protein